jgi:hypothetical protein
MKSALVLVLLCVPSVICGQARSATCEVTPLWSIKGGVRSANIGAIGKFVADGKESSTTRSFKMPQTNLIVTSSIAYLFDYSHRPEPVPFRIALAITVAPQEMKDIFESADSSEASTRYNKDWNLSVTKNIYFDGRTYIFTLSCWDGSKQLKVPSAPIGSRKRQLFPFL